MATPPALALRHIFGLRSDVNSNIHFVDDSLVIYPAANQIVLYNTDTRTQRFIHIGSDNGEDHGTSAIAISPKDRKYIAVAERSARAIVTVYNVHTLKRVRTPLQSADCASDVFVSVAFSPDQRNMLTQGGAPDYLLINWLWEKNRPLQSIKLGSSGANVRVAAASYCPTDPTLIAVIGTNMLKFLKIESSEFKVQQATIKEKKDSQELLCLDWDGDRLLIGSEDGDIFVFEGTEHRRTCSTPHETAPVHSLAVYSKGFVCGCDDGVVHVFERIEDKDREEQDRDLYRPYKTFRVENMSRVISMSVSPSGDSLALTLDNSQAYTLNLSQIDILKTDEMNFEILAQEFHSSGVVDVDVCIRKPLIVTCSQDCTIRIWNYEENTCELSCSFEEVPISCSFHPSGLHLLVGFPDRLSLMNVLMDDIRGFRDMAVKDCRCSAFSHGGQYFAAVSGSSIAVYGTYTGENMLNLRGHSGKVRSLCWSEDDEHIISSSIDGSVLKWEMGTGNRLQDFEQKNCNFNSAVIAPDQHIFAVGNDSILREIVDGKVSTTLEMDMSMSHLCMKNSGTRHIFAASATGAIRAFKMPLSANFQSLWLHSGPINALIMSHDESFLFAVGEDGCLSVLEVRDTKEAKSSGKREKREMAWAEEILVCRADLQERISLMKELSDKVEELTLHNEYQMRLKEMNYQEQKRGLHEKYNNELKADRQKYSMLQDEKDALELKYRTKIEELRTQQAKELRELDAYHKKKIKAEKDRFTELSTLMDSQKKRHSEEKGSRAVRNTAELEELREEYRAKIERERQLALRIEAEKNAIIEEFEDTKRVLEQDADREIDELKEAYDAKLAAERKLTLQLGGNNGVLKAKFAKMQSRIKKQKQQIEKMVDDERKLYDSIRGLEKDIEGYQKEISERDSTIADKDKRISDLRKKNQELEKFKFVLDYKIRELNRQIQPREIEIEKKKKQLEEMNAEVRKYKTEYAVLQLNVKELNLKLNGMNDELERQSARNQQLQKRIERFCRDVQYLSLDLEDNKKLKKGIIKLYQRHARDSQNDTELREENTSDATKEYQRHRVYLEKSVDSLKRKLVKDMRVHKKDNLRIMQENITLIAEINELRRDIRYAKDLELRVESLDEELELDAKLAQQRKQIQSLQRKVGQQAPNRASLLPPGSASRGKRSAPTDDFTPREEEVQQ